MVLFVNLIMESFSFVVSMTSMMCKIIFLFVILFLSFLLIVICIFFDGFCNNVCVVSMCLILFVLILNVSVLNASCVVVCEFSYIIVVFGSVNFCFGLMMCMIFCFLLFILKYVILNFFMFFFSCNICM